MCTDRGTSDRELNAHSHYACSVQLRGKTDSFYVECSCGEAIAVGTWQDEAPPGWANKGWMETIQSGQELTQAWTAAETELRGSTNGQAPNEFGLSYLFPGQTLLYLAGRWEDASRAWEVLGIFSCEEQAAKRCSKATDFVSMLILDESAPEETAGFPAIRYPHHPDRYRWDHLGTIHRASNLACIRPHLSKEYLDALAKCECRWGVRFDKNCPLHGSVDVTVNDDRRIVLEDK